MINDRQLIAELKKLVNSNKITITDNSDSYDVLINGITITVNKINNNVNRSNLITNR